MVAKCQGNKLYISHIDTNITTAHVPSTKTMDNLENRIGLLANVDRP